jgi:hypothetical protein
MVHAIADWRRLNGWAPELMNLHAMALPEA